VKELGVAGRKILERTLDTQLWTGFMWLRIGVSEHGTESSGSIRGGTPFDNLNDYQLLKKSSVPFELDTEFLFLRVINTHSENSIRY